MWPLAAIFTSIIWNLAAMTAKAETHGDETRGSTREADEWLATAAALNRPTMADAAGSHGSYGFELGVGFSRQSTNPDNRIISEETSQSEDRTGSSAIDLPRLWIAKGTMLPIDLTITAGSTRDRRFASTGAILQVTVFEALALPAVSVRGYGGRTFGKTNTTLESSGAEAAVSMGFLRYCSAYFTTGRVRHDARLAVAPGSDAYLSLMENTTDGHYRKSWQETTRTAGLKVTVIPGRMSLSAETNWVSTNRDEFSMRLTTSL
jgi:hypothetical protein